MVLFSGHTAHNCHLSFTRSCDLFGFRLRYPSLPHKPLSETVIERLAYAYTPLDPNDLILNDLLRNIVCCTFKYRCKLILPCWLNYCFQYCRFLRVIPYCLARVQTIRETTLAYLKSWRHSRLWMTSQWSDNCEAITWIMISNLLDITFIHGNIHGRSFKKRWLFETYIIFAYSLPTFWTTFEQHLWFHGIPWNLSNKTSNSMKFHGIPDPKFHGIPWTFSILPSSMEFLWTSNFHEKKFHRIPTFFLKFREFRGTWLIRYLENHISKYCRWYLIDDVILLKSHRNATCFIDFNIVIRILNPSLSAKMAQGQRKWHYILPYPLMLLQWHWNNRKIVPTLMT